MRKLFPAFIFLACLACTEISYKTPQPKGTKALSSVPSSLQGSYLIINEQENSHDTVVVKSTGYMAVSDQKSNTLGDSLVLTKYKGYYFLSINENPEWLLRVIRPEKNGDLTILSMDTDEKNFNSLLRKLSKEVRIDSLVLPTEKLYQIDPTPKQLLGLIKKGYFSKTTLMQKLK